MHLEGYQGLREAAWGFGWDPENERRHGARLPKGLWRGDMKTDTTKAGDWTRPCRDCEKLPGEVEFGVGVRRGDRVYRKSYCRDCHSARAVSHDKKHPDKVKVREARRDRDWTKERRKAWKQDPDAMRRSIREKNVRSKFGISLEEYEFRFEQQGGMCNICSCEIDLDGKLRELPEGIRAAHLDHEHSTGKIRSFLCDRCNVMIGMAQERNDILLAAIEYLDKGKV